MSCELTPDLKQRFPNYFLVFPKSKFPTKTAKETTFCGIMLREINIIFKKFEP